MSIYSLLCFKVHPLIQNMLFVEEGIVRLFFSTFSVKEKALLGARTIFNLKCKQVALCFANINQVKVESNQKYNYLKSTRYRQNLLE